MSGSGATNAATNFFAEWLSSTAQMVFAPATFGADAKRRQNQNLAFAASSLGIAFTIFEIVNNDMKLSAESALAFLLMGTWCLYSIISAGLVKLLNGKEDYATNIVVGIRLFSVFYIIEMVIGVLAYLITGDRTVFNTIFIFVGTILYIFYFPIVFCKLNALKGMRAFVFIAICLPLAAGRSLVAEQIALRNLGPPPMMAPPPVMAPPPLMAPPVK
jgi:hypothetical protein